MSYKSLLGYLIVAMLCIPATAMAQLSPQPSCNIADTVSQRRNIRPADQSKVFFDEIAILFQQHERKEISDGYYVGLPTLEVNVNWDSFLALLSTELHNDFGKQANDNDIDFINSGFNSVTVSNESLSITGWAKFEKWAKWDWVCCKWFKCRRCEAKTRLFSKTVNFVIKINKLDVLNVNQGENYAVDTARVTKQRAASIHILEDISFDSFGNVVGNQDFLEQIFDVISGTVDVVTSLWGDDQLQFQDIYSASSGLPEYALGSRELLKAEEYDYAYDRGIEDSTGLAGHRHRGFWQAFFSSLYLDGPQSGFFSKNGATKFKIVYRFDLDQYYAFQTLDGVFSKDQKPNENQEVPTARIDILYHPWLCSVGGEVFAKYLDFVKDKYEGTEPTSTLTMNGKETNDEILEKIDEAYPLIGASEYFEPNIEEFKVPGQILLPTLQTLMRQEGITPIEGSLWSMASEGDWTQEELSCAMNVARKRTGSPDLIFPFQRFDECLVDKAEISLEQSIDELYDRFGDELFLEETASRLVSPLVGAAKYRGWYYCYRTPSLCSGKKIVIWFDDYSEFGGRNGAHKGVDLIDTASGGTTRMQAVATGRLVYNNRNPRGWGHALLLPFRTAGRDYFAVYAHLAPSVRSLDGKLVRVGDAIGQSACTGNAGDGNGNCNDYCHVNGAYRTDNHLHFEVLEKSTGGLKKIDPTKIFRFPIDHDNDKNIYRCKDVDALALVGN